MKKRIIIPMGLNIIPLVIKLALQHNTLTIIDGVRTTGKFNFLYKGDIEEVTATKQASPMVYDKEPSKYITKPKHNYRK